jgi:hypothetical protein
MRRRAVAIALLASCGRYGFSGDDGVAGEAGIAKPDTGQLADADPTIDAALGVGDYTVIESSAPYILLASPTPIVAAGAGADDELFPLALGFTFTFYGIAYTQALVAANGYVTFGNPPAGADNYTNECPLDATPPDSVIAVFWDDLFASKAVMPYGSIGYVESGVAPDRTITIEWRDMDAFYNAGTGGNNFTQLLDVTQAVVLHENGTIDLHYGPRTAPQRDRDCGLERHLGCSATVGLEAPSTTMTKLVQCGTAGGTKISYTPLVEGRLITFTPQ